jgi:hypothetical protein
MLFLRHILSYGIVSESYKRTMKKIKSKMAFPLHKKTVKRYILRCLILLRRDHTFPGEIKQ